MPFISKEVDSGNSNKNNNNNNENNKKHKKLNISAGNLVSPTELII